MTRYACLAAVGAVILLALPAEPQGIGPRRKKGGGKSPAKAVQRPTPRPATPNVTRPKVQRPAPRATPRTRGFVPSQPRTRPDTRLTRPAVPRKQPVTRQPRPIIPTARPDTQTTRPKTPSIQPKTPSIQPKTPSVNRPPRRERPPVTVRPRPGSDDQTTRPDPTPRPGRPGVIDRTPGELTRPDRDRVDRDPRDRIDRGDRLDPDRRDRDRLNRDQRDRDRDRRPIIVRPDIDIRNRNRTDIDIRNRYRNRTDIDVRNRWGGYRQVGAPRSWYTQPRNWGRDWWGGRPAWHWGRPWYWHHAHWHHGYWNFWVTPPALWFGTGVLGGWLLSPGDTFVYYNPYYVALPTVTTWLNYSEPLPIVSAELEGVALPPDPNELAEPDAMPSAPSDETVAEAYRLLDRARESFRAGQYAQAQVEIETAIRLVPSDPALHELRALTLFAQAKFQEAAATLYAVLTAGPGWDWQTMKDLYPDTETYVAQLRVLERFVAERPDAGYGHFLSAYHYLVTGSRDAAIQQLRETVRVQPDDKLAQALLTSLTTADATGATGPPPAPGR